MSSISLGWPKLIAVVSKKKTLWDSL